MRKKFPVKTLFCSFFGATLCLGLTLNTNFKSTIKPAYAATSYDLWVAGIQVTDDNKDNILVSGEGATGTASFDPLTNTLSLNNFNIVPQDSGSTSIFDASWDYQLNEIGIASKLDSLIIDVTNNAKIGEEVEYEEGETTSSDFEFRQGIISTGDIEINGSGKFFVYGGDGALYAENLTIDMDFGDEANSQATFESLSHVENFYSDDAAAVWANKDFNLLNGYIFVECFEKYGILSTEGDITIQESQLEITAGHDCISAFDGDCVIDNAYIGLTAYIAGIEILDRNIESKGNLTIKNHSFVYDITSETATASLYGNTVNLDDSRVYIIGNDESSLYSGVLCYKFNMTGDSLLYSNCGMGLVMQEGPSKINMTGGTVITSSQFGLYGGGESQNDFIVGSDSTPFTIKNGGMLDEESGEIVSIESSNGVVPTYDFDGLYASNIGPADPEENEGFVEINTYATVTMPDYEYGETVSTPSIDHELAKLWGTEIEEVMYLYYADGEDIADSKMWEDIEPTTLDEGEYYIYAYIVDGLIPMFEYVSEPTKFEVTRSAPAEIDIPDVDTTEFTYNGAEQTYGIPENDAYTIGNNKQTNAGTYTVTVSLNDKTSSTWSDGTTDDLTYEFVIAKADQAIEISEITKIYDKSPLIFAEYDTYHTTNYYKKLGDGVVSVEYKLESEDDSAYTTDVPVNAGNYVVKVSVAEGTNYKAGSATQNFTIDHAVVSKVGFGDLAQPVAGEAAPTEVTGIAIGSRYAGTISWSSTLVEGNFDYNTVYTATVTLEIVPSSSDNYQFAENVTLVKPTQGWTKSSLSTPTTLIYTKTFEITGKIPQVIEITNDISKVYDGNAVNAPTFTKLGDGVATIEYKLASEDDSAYTTTAPIEIGDYVVRVSVAATDTHLEGFATAEFSITAAVVADCHMHWFLIGLLGVGLVVLAIFFLIIKKKLLGIIASAALLVASGVMAIFCGCTICIVFAVIDVVVFLASGTYFFVKSKKKKDDKNEENKDQK